MNVNEVTIQVLDYFNFRKESLVEMTLRCSNLQTMNYLKITSNTSYHHIAYHL